MAKRIPFLFFALFLLVPFLVMANGQKQASSAKYPTHNIRFIVPFKPGGGSDRSVRRLEPVAQNTLGVKWNIIYQTGGSGADGFQTVFHAKPTGYTVGNVVLPNLILLSQKGQNVGFKAGKFKYVAMTAATPSALSVGENSKFKTLKGFISYAKAHPGKVTVGGIGVKGKLEVAMIQHAAGVKLDYVPISGGAAPLVVDLEGGHLDAGLFGSSHVLENAGKIRALALASDTADPALPNVPTFASAGYQGVLMVTTWGVIAPPNTPASVVKTLNHAVEKAVSSSKVQAQDKKYGLIALHQTPQQAQAYFNKVQNAMNAAEKLLKK